ncbi:DUF2460 domain-containing protein [Pseudomonas sp. JS3066]|uniref:DUF2460 domain-containing protein n=1 Tax=Pseudomonas sp. JS3066 TaxID=3090665 RepID=UPI002E7AFC5B|nr:DUF2460 domain-containing protein [Pseudomonas sp. JS3066]WVK96242.1 DUF2460 domain-containing protein [Pseudomonas sp. JS3066]
MAMFLEERLTDKIDYGSGFAAAYSNQIVVTAGGDEYRSQRHPFVKATMAIEFEKQTVVVIDDMIDLNHRAGGTLRGFRVLHPVDFSSNNYRDAPTAFDQALPLVNPTVPGVYQLMRWYGNSADPACARRRIRKPQAGTVLVAVGGVIIPSPAQWSVDNTTGIVTMAADKTGTITGISKASQAVFTANNTLAIGDTLRPSGILGMTQMNGLRGTVVARTATQFTLDINSTAFSTYTSGGTFNTRPQSGEAVTAGFKFDLPMRFNADLAGDFSNWDTIATPSIQLIEILNP